MRKKIELELIYQAALQNFAKYGLRKTTLNDIASDLGVTKSNLYRYTQNKESLYREAVSYALRNWQDRTKKALMTIQSPREQLITLCKSAYTYLSEDDIFCEILKNDPDIFPMFPAHDDYEEINAESIQMLRTIIQNGIDQGEFRSLDPDQIAMVFFAIYKMFIIQTYIRADEHYMSRVFEETLDLLTKGLFKDQSDS
jgi:AcrR family transcriptional regulator